MVNKDSGNLTIKYTETAKFSIRQCAAFLRSRKIEPKLILQAVISEFEGKVSRFPEGCTICQQLLEIGCNTYRECNTKNGYRILYRYHSDNKSIIVHVILHQRQDIQSLLYQRIISW